MITTENTEITEFNWPSSKAASLAFAVASTVTAIYGSLLLRALGVLRGPFLQSGEELVELARLDRLANEHFDQVAPPPMEDARQLHDRLLRNRGDNGH